MGSRIMHFIIGKRVSELIEVSAIDAFLLGCVAIDWVIDKEKSHYYSGVTSEYTRHIDYELFYKDNYNKSSDFSLGCYVHLIADDLWLQGMYLPWLRYMIKSDESKQEEYHKDFMRLNSILINKYDYAQALNDLNVENIGVGTIKDIDFRDFKKLKNQLLLDVSVESHGNLEVFKEEQIVAHIETCVEKIVSLVNKKRTFNN